MSNWYVLAFLLIFSLCSDIKCPKYTCFEFGNDICARHSYEEGNSILYLKKCKESKVCDITDLHEEQVCKDYYSTPMLLPGEYCRNNTECYSGACTKDSNICNGTLLNDNCISDSECNPGLYCKEHVCVDTKKENNECDSINKCAAGLICNNKICIKIGSKSYNETATAPAACRSFFIDNGVCAPGPKINQSDKYACPESGICTYFYGDNNNLTEGCHCGMTNTSKAYCNPGRGDVNSENVI